jgi:hypothetical protein
VSELGAPEGVISSNAFFGSARVRLIAARGNSIDHRCEDRTVRDLFWGETVMGLRKPARAYRLSRSKLEIPATSSRASMGLDKCM